MRPRCRPGVRFRRLTPRQEIEFGAASNGPRPAVLLRRQFCYLQLRLSPKAAGYFQGFVLYGTGKL